MKTKKWTSLCMAVTTALCLGACQDWGEIDAPAGNQKIPEKPDTSAKLLANFTFEEDLSSNENDTLIIGEVFTYPGGEEPQIVEDGDRGNVLHQKGGYTRFPNPLKGVEIQNGVSLSMWVKMPKIDKEGALFSFTDGGSNTLYFTANAFLSYEGTGGWLEVNNPESAVTNAFSTNKWQYVSLVFHEKGYAIYINGKRDFDTDNHMSSGFGKTRAVEVKTFDYATITKLLTTVPYLYLGYGSPSNTEETYFDEVKVYKNLFSEEDAKGPNMDSELRKPVYINTFDSPNGTQIIGAGKFISVADKGFGKVFQNAVGGKRQNYLLLPETALSHSAKSMEMSIGVWVNSTYAGTSADYMWAPLFMAYGAAPVNGANTTPMMALQYRGIPQINCSGFCDFTDAQSTTGGNKLYHNDTDWLADHQWHYCTITFTETTCTLYMDGKIANAWEVSGSGDGNVIKGLLTNGSDLKYICLGGNQAWDWGDNDPGFMFDDIAIYDVALSKSDIQAIIEAKSVAAPSPVYLNNFESGAGDSKVVGAGSFVTVADNGFGKVFQNAVGGKRQNYLLLPENALSHSVTSMQTSIGVWVNATNAGSSADYQFSPLFMAYGAAPVNDENTWPVLALQYRGIPQINCAGWCNFDPAQNVAGANTEYNNDKDWLADHKWHYFTATFTETTAKIYFDGKLANEWEVTGIGDGQVIKGLFTNGADLKYICLGGNQAWNWGDPDPGFMFDDIAIFDMELTPEQIALIMSSKQ